jgi:hypothetical protein
MRVECEICGAYTEDPNEIECAKKNRICPGCGHIGSLSIAEEDEGTYIVIDTMEGNVIGVFNDRELAGDGISSRVDFELERMFAADPTETGLVRERDEELIRKELYDSFKIKKFNAINVIELN